MIRFNRLNRLMKFLITGLLLIFSTFAYAGTVAPIVNTPPYLDYQIIDQMWEYIKKETGAPSDIPPPKLILDWHVPITARMGTYAPIAGGDADELAIHIAPRTIDMWDSLMVLYGIGHEMTHYALILKENGWKIQPVYTVTWKHHCNPKFKEINRGLGTLLWNIYHSSDNLAKVNEEVVKSCANFPNQ